MLSRAVASPQSCSCQRRAAPASERGLSTPASSSLLVVVVLGIVGDIEALPAVTGTPLEVAPAEPLLGAVTPPATLGLAGVVVMAEPLPAALTTGADSAGLSPFAPASLTWSDAAGLRLALERPPNGGSRSGPAQDPATVPRHRQTPNHQYGSKGRWILRFGRVTGARAISAVWRLSAVP
jgi:hypothetical protein